MSKAKNPFVGYIVHSAKKRYVCDGCCGEFPIIPESWYYVRKKGENGRIKTVRLCQRCYFALMGKLDSHGGEWSMENRGALKWNTLANAFKKEWVSKFVEGYENLSGARQNPLSKQDLKDLERDGKPRWLK